MPRSYSIDLRERVGGAVEEGGMTRRRDAARFGVGVSTVIAWVRRFRETGSVAPGQMGGYKPVLLAAHRDFVQARFSEQPELTLRGLQQELAGRGVVLSYGAVWAFVHAEGLSLEKPLSPANKIVPASPGGAANGRSIRPGLIPAGLSSSMGPGPRRIWRRIGTLLDTFTAQERNNYLVNSGYAAT